MKKSIHTPEQVKLQDLLRQIRKGATLTQVQLAERLDIQQCEVSAYERGEKMLDLLELCQVLDAVGVPLMEFMATFERVVRSGED